ncbi:hypothetical protein HY797_03715 [Candidatus Falkowbacteria bacterium]|nr:hypothetical protein [Candidatus Falkowbacteria bacterium]
MQLPSDTTAPIATGAWLTSNETDMAVAYPGTLIDLDFAINEQLKALPIVTIFGRPADMVIDLGFNGFDYDYYAYSTATATDPLGPVSFTIDFTDLAGNHGTQTATTDGSLVTLYNPTHPVCQTGADINGNGSINITELLNYIADWKIGNVSLTLLLKAIGFWKIGTGC